MAVRSAHHALILGRSDDANTHLGGIIWNIPDLFLGQVRDALMLIIILHIAILGVDMISKLGIKIILQLHLRIRSLIHLRWALFLLRRLTTKITPS